MNNSTVLSHNHDELLVRVSWYYYKQGMIQSEIAKILKTNRVKVKRLLEEAFDRGIVEIRVKNPYVNLLEIEKEIIEKYNLLDSVVIPNSGLESSKLNLQLGKAAAQYISTIFQEEDILAFGWGDSVSKTIEHLNLDEYKNFYLISLSGGLLSLISEANFLGKYSKHLKILPAPLLVSSETTAKAIYEEQEVQNIIKMWEISNHILIGIGSLAVNATIIKQGYISEVESASLKQKGIVGDILGQFYDKDGNKITHETDKRIIAQDVEKIKSRGNVIAVAGGVHKTKAILAALKGGYVNTLITDEKVAKELLE